MKVQNLLFLVTLQSKSLHSIYINQSVLLGVLFQWWHPSMYLFSKLWYQGCLKIRSDYIEFNCVDLSNIKGLKCDKFWIIYSRILQVPQTLWRLLSNCWRLRFFFRAFSNVWNQPIFHDAAKTVQIGTCQLRMIFVSSQREYKRDKRESILRCTDDADQGLVTLCTSSIAFHSRTNLVFHENMYSPHVVYWCYRYFQLKNRELLPHTNQGCENWCSGA